MSLKSKIEAVIYASEEPVTLAQLAGLLAEEAQSEIDAIAAQQPELPLKSEGSPEEVGLAFAEASSEAGDQEDAAQSAPSESPEEEAAASASPTTGSEEDLAPSVAAVDPEAEKRAARERERGVREHIRATVDRLIRDYAESDRGIEVREVAGGFRMGTKPEYHDAVRGFVRSLKPALKLSLQALETLAVVAYKQPVTAAEISEIRGVDSAGVLGGLLTRKLIQTAGRKQVIGRPMLYKTTKEFLVRFGLKDIQELPSMEEFERMAGELNEQEDLPMDATDTVIERANVRGDAEHIREVTGNAEEGLPEDPSASPQLEAQPSDAAPAETVSPEPESPTEETNLSPERET